MSVDDPLRQLMGLHRATAAPQAIGLDEQARRAAETAPSILDADPALGPIETVYVERDEDVSDMRYLIVLFQGKKGFLFDRTIGRTTVIELDDRGLVGDQRLAAKLESAKVAAAKAKLSKVYVVKH